MPRTLPEQRGLRDRGSPELLAHIVQSNLGFSARILGLIQSHLAPAGQKSIKPAARTPSRRTPFDFCSRRFLIAGRRAS